MDWCTLIAGGRDATGADSPPAAAVATGVRSTVFINGAATPLRNARALGAALVDINSQNAAAALRSPVAQLALLDRLARCAPLATEFAHGLARLQAVRARLEELSDFEDGSLRQNEQVCCAVLCSSMLSYAEEEWATLLLHDA